jgi:hypothetical protein
MDPPDTHPGQLREEIAEIKKGLEEITVIVRKSFSASGLTRASTHHRRDRPSHSAPRWAQDLQTVLTAIRAKVDSVEKKLLLPGQRSGEGQPKVTTAEGHSISSALAREGRAHMNVEAGRSPSPNTPRSLEPSQDAFPDKGIVLRKPSMSDIRISPPSPTAVLDALTQLIGHDSFDGRVFISRHTDLDKLTLVSLDDGIYFQNLVRPGDVQGACHVTIDQQKAPVAWPDTSLALPRPTQDEMREAFEEFVSNPPERVSYYGGCASAFTDHFLSPLGKTLPETISHANVPYFHVGERLSSTPCHVEDANFWSCNIVEFGWKLWIIIHDTAKFEDFVRKNWQTNDCRNFVRHVDLVISPSRLQKENIAFDLFCAGRGDMIITRPGVYHQVLNYTPCIALSVNFILPGEPFLPDHFEVCQDCGLYPLKGSSGVEVVPARPKPTRTTSESHTMKPKRKADVATESAGRKTRARNDLDEALGDIRAMNPDCVPPYDPRHPPPVHVLRLAAAIRHKMTNAYLQQLRDRMSCYRQKSTFTFLPSEDRLLIHGRILNDAAIQSEFSKLRLRIAELEFVKEATTRRPGHLKRLPADVRQDLIRRLGWSERQFSSHLERGKAWIRLCGNYTTLLCFLPEKGNELGIHIKQYLALDDSDLAQLHVLLSDEQAERVFAAAETAQHQVLFLEEVSA